MNASDYPASYFREGISFADNLAYCNWVDLPLFRFLGSKCFACLSPPCFVCTNLTYYP